MNIAKIMESSLRGEKVTGKTHTEINFIVNDYIHWRVRQRVKYERKSRHRYHVYANSPRRNGRARRNGQHPFPHLSYRRVCLYTGSLHWPGSVYTHAELFPLTRPCPCTHVPPLLRLLSLGPHRLSVFSIRRGTVTFHGIDFLLWPVDY